MRKLLASLAMTLACLTAFAQSPGTLHIVSDHRALHDSEKSYHTEFNQRIFVGTLDGKQYTLAILDAFGVAKGIEIGQDYKVLKVGRNDLTIEVLVHYRKGDKVEKRNLSILTVEEVPSGSKQ